ncbi:hypothetical protein GOODEAATRI_033738 [Goodea atripinnis]|uniref:Uncharacterized protein n=1 Tax=Goodea atripinnis TaxID=208336 RepID=A0ABV0N6G5_9TELE
MVPRVSNSCPFTALAAIIYTPRGVVADVWAATTATSHFPAGWLGPLDLGRETSPLVVLLTRHTKYSRLGSGPQEKWRDPCTEMETDGLVQRTGHHGAYASSEQDNVHVAHTMNAVTDSPGPHTGTDIGGAWGRRSLRPFYDFSFFHFHLTASLCPFSSLSCLQQVLPWYAASETPLRSSAPGQWHLYL